jgi:hypothetical protein
VTCGGRRRAGSVDHRPVAGSFGAAAFDPSGDAHLPNGPLHDARNCRVGRRDRRRSASLCREGVQGACPALSGASSGALTGAFSLSSSLSFSLSSCRTACGGSARPTRPRSRRTRASARRSLPHRRRSDLRRRAGGGRRAQLCVLAATETGRWGTVFVFLQRGDGRFALRCNVGPGWPAGSGRSRGRRREGKRAAFRADPIADREDRVEVVELDVPNDASRTLALNRCIFCNSCGPVELPRQEDAPQVPRNQGLIATEQLGQLP